MKVRVWCLWLLAAALALGGAAPAASGGHEQRVNKGMSLVSVFPGMTATSVPLTIRVKAKGIPENAVVTRVTVVTGNISTGARPMAANVIESYNLKGPGMEDFARKRWAGKGRPTVFDADELGGDGVPVAGTWQLSMTGNNVGRARATTSHTIRTLKFEYEY